MEGDCAHNCSKLALSMEHNRMQLLKYYTWSGASLSSSRAPVSSIVSNGLASSTSSLLTLPFLHNGNRSCCAWPSRSWPGSDEATTGLKFGSVLHNLWRCSQIGRLWSIFSWSKYYEDFSGCCIDVQTHTEDIADVQIFPDLLSS